MYEIREFDIKDKEELIKLWLDIIVEEYGYKEWEEDVKILNEDTYDKLLVATYEGRIIGTAAYEHLDEETAELRRLYLQKEHRGKGIAKKLYKELQDLIKDNNYKKIIARTTKCFKGGTSFYYRNNFELVHQEGDSCTFSLNIE